MIMFKEILNLFLPNLKSFIIEYGMLNVIKSTCINDHGNMCKLQPLQIASIV